MLNDIR